MFFNGSLFIGVWENQYMAEMIFWRLAEEGKRDVFPQWQRQPFRFVIPKSGETMGNAACDYIWCGSG